MGDGGKGSLLTRREMSLAQRLHYLELGLRVEVSLEEAIRLLSLRQSAESDPVHVERIYKSIRRLERAWLTVHADLIAFASGDQRARPPDSDLQRRVDERSALLAGLLPDSPPSVALTLAGDIIDQWASTRPGGTIRVELESHEHARDTALPPLAGSPRPNTTAAPGSSARIADAR